MDTKTWGNEAALEWHQLFMEWNGLHGSQFGTIAELATTLTRLNRQMATASRSQRMTNAQMNSRLMTMSEHMGYEDMTRDLVIREGQYIFSSDERSWVPFDDLVARYTSFEAWRQRNSQNSSNGLAQVRSNESAGGRPPRNASLEQNMRSVTLHDRVPSREQPQHRPQEWEQAPAYSEEANFDYYRSDEKRSQPPPVVQKRALARSGTQRAFDFAVRSSQAPSVPGPIDLPPVGEDGLVPPPPLLSPRQIKDKRSSRRSMRYDTEEFMS
jgi:hypothetical protein